MSFRDVKVGDIVERQFGEGGPTMKLKVSAVDDHLIHCGAWSFDRDLGIEEDEELGWGRRFGATGSFLVRQKSSAEDRTPSLPSQASR